MEIEKTSHYYGTYVHGIDFSKKVDDLTISKLKELWWEHQLLIFTHQHLSPDNLENMISYFGEYCEDPYIQPIEGYRYVAEVLREADETTEIFAEGWHSDWFHMSDPPKGTALYAKEIPPYGGDTLFADLYKAYEDLPLDLKNIVDTKTGINSARRGYAPDARYGVKDLGRSMRLVYSEDAYKTQLHPMSMIHPETGKKVISCNRGYTIGIKDMDHEKTYDILGKIFQHQKQEKYVYSHKWKPNELVLWDNRCLLHRATGGYQGYRRSLQRITIK